VNHVVRGNPENTARPPKTPERARRGRGGRRRSSTTAVAFAPYSGLMTMTNAAPSAVHIGADELPFVEIGSGNKMKVLQVRETEGLWIVENIFQAGFEVQTHRHTGPVWGYTVSGGWKYKEYDYVNRAGSFLYEPAGSVHTLQCIEGDTRVWFHMYGVNLNLDADGNVDSVSDGAGSLKAYYAMCEAQGIPRPNVLVG
jgi:2,4'-dihydroxyacetophenone dioxygenase